MLRTFLALLLCTTTLEAAGKVRAADLTRRAAQAEQCLNSKIREHAIEHPGSIARAGPETAIFVSERIVMSIQNDQATGVPAGPFIELSVEEFCQKFLVDPYFAALPAAEAERRDEAKGGLAPLGTDEIESTSIFVQGYQNLIGKHYKGHSDLTRDAVSKWAAGGDSFSLAAVTLTARAAQTPDLFRWNDERYHAHSPEYDPADLQDRRRQIKRGQMAYMDLMCSLQSEFVRRTENGSPEEGLFLLGVMAHAVQDLTYHRGMTLRQHAGLSYAVKHNPDFPDGALAGHREQEAVRNTTWMLAQSRARVSASAWRSLTKWVPSGDFAFDKTASYVFGANGATATQDAGVGPLLDYWGLSLPYKTGARSLAELQTGACGADSGIACWDVGAILKQIEERLTAHEQCR